MPELLGFRCLTVYVLRCVPHLIAERVELICTRHINVGRLMETNTAFACTQARQQLAIGINFCDIAHVQIDVSTLDTEVKNVVVSDTVSRHTEMYLLFETWRDFPDQVA